MNGIACQVLPLARSVDSSTAGRITMCSPGGQPPVIRTSASSPASYGSPGAHPRHAARGPDRVAESIGADRGLGSCTWSASWMSGSSGAPTRRSGWDPTAFDLRRIVPNGRAAGERHVPRSGIVDVGQADDRLGLDLVGDLGRPTRKEPGRSRKARFRAWSSDDRVGLRRDVSSPSWSGARPHWMAVGRTKPSL